MFHSYKGGSGKTLLSVNVASHLASNLGKRVLLIEADFTMPMLSDALDTPPDIFLNNYLEDQTMRLEECIYDSENEDADYILTSPDFKMSERVFSYDLSWFDTTLHRMKNDLERLEYDVVIFDMSPGKSLFSINSILMSNRIFLPMRPDRYSFEGTKNLIRNFYSNVDLMKDKNLYIIINQVPRYEKINPLVDSWAIKLEDVANQNVGVGRMHFEDETAYHVASQGIKLPKNDPSFAKINELISSFIPNL